MADVIFSKLLTQNITVYRKSEGSVDKWGVPEETLNSTTVKGLIQPNDERLEIEKKGKKYTPDFVGFFEYDEDISVDDILEYNGQKFLVLFVEDPSGTEHHKEALLRKL